MTTLQSRRMVLTPPKVIASIQKIQNNANEIDKRNEEIRKQVNMLKLYGKTPIYKGGKKRTGKKCRKTSKGKKCRKTRKGRK
jgi:hypothetical protein